MRSGAFHMKSAKKWMSVLLGTLLAFVLAVQAFAATAVTDTHIRPSMHGALHVEGGKLADAKNEPVQLKGVSMHGLAWYPYYVNTQAFQDIQNLFDADLVRLPVYTVEYGGYCSGGNKEDLQDLVRGGIRAASNADMYVIVDWHVLSDRDPNVYVKEAVDFFDTLSKEFSSQNNVIYEICNEPNSGTDWASIKRYAETVIPVIRKNAPNALILVGTPNWSQYIDEAQKDPITGYDNIMYTMHFYAATHKDDMRQRLENACAAGLPVFISEFSISEASGSGYLDTAEGEKWMELINRYGLSYVGWSFCNKNESSALLRQDCTGLMNFTAADLSPAGQWLAAH